MFFKDYSLIDLIKNLIAVAKTTTRWQGMRGERENIIEHSQNLAILCRLCWKMEKELNPGIKLNLAKILSFAVFHDIVSEPLMGDIVTPIKHGGLNDSIKKIEADVTVSFKNMFLVFNERYGSGFGDLLKEEITSIMTIQNKPDSLDYRFFKAVEYLDQLYENIRITNRSDEYIFRAVRQAPDWEISTVKKIRDSGFVSIWKLFVRDLKSPTEDIIRKKGRQDYCVEDADIGNTK